MIRLFITYIVVASFILCPKSVSAQIGRYADSLQIKTYVTITYKNKQPKAITVNKVFCDYCNENQKKHLSERAWQLAYFERYNPKNIIANGKRRLTFLIRMSKVDLKRLRTQIYKKSN